MKTKFLYTLILAGAVGAPLVTHAAEDMDKDRSSPKAFVKDSVITTKIKAAMAKDSEVSATKIKVDTDNSGVVTLSGTAKSQREADKAIQIAKGTEGVMSVNSQIHVGEK